MPIPPTAASPVPVGIPTAEFGVRHHISDLCRWINAKLEAIKAGGRFDEQYFERTGQNVKKLIEEVVPVSRLGLFLWTPGSEVFVTCYVDNEDHEALIEVEGFAAQSFKVEVTTTESEASTLRRQALAREGTVTLAGPIRKEGRTIIPDYVMIDVDEESEKYVECALDRLREKVNSRRWDGKTVILVFLSDFWTLPPRGRADLNRKTERYLESERPKIPAVYYCYGDSYSIDVIRGD
jgi:hypothetical protein